MPQSSLYSVLEISQLKVTPGLTINLKTFVQMVHFLLCQTYNQETFQTDVLQRKVDFLTTLKRGTMSWQTGVFSLMICCCREVHIWICHHLQEHVIMVKAGIWPQWNKTIKKHCISKDTCGACHTKTEILSISYWNYVH